MLLLGKNPDGTEKDPAYGTDAYYAMLKERQKHMAPPPVVSLNIEHIIAKRVSRATDGATDVLFAVLDGAVSKIGSKAAGIGGSLSIHALRGAGVSFDDVLRSEVFTVNDDLLILLDNIGQWPAAWTGSNSVSIGNGQKKDVHMSWTSCNR
ncbi:MAG: hypothetical protein ACJAVV_001689 [Alphaproteobacteria bacterium]|jgi:hypothetical protein